MERGLFDGRLRVYITTWFGADWVFCALLRLRGVIIHFVCNSPLEIAPESVDVEVCFGIKDFLGLIWLRVLTHSSSIAQSVNGWNMLAEGMASRPVLRMNFCHGILVINGAVSLRISSRTCFWSLSELKDARFALILFCLCFIVLLSALH